MNKKAYLTAVLLTALMLSVLVASTVTVHAAATWTIQTIDPNSTGPSQMAIDSNNNPYISYGHYENTSNRSPVTTMYANWTGSTWNKQTIPGLKNFDGFVLDSRNNLHLLYAGSDGLKYWSNGIVQTVTNETYEGVLALDSASNPHVAYTTDFGLHALPDGKTIEWQSIKYTSWTGTSWNSQTVDSGQVGVVSLALDKNNYPHIMYINQTDYFPPDGSLIPTWSVKLATWNGSTWNIQTAFSRLSGFSNMVLDSKGYPHFLYRQDYPLSTSGNSTLSYASWNGSAWNSQIVVANANLGDTAFIALDSYDYPHIDYTNETAGAESISLIYAGWTGSVWDTQIVGPNSLAIYAGPIAVDSKGNVHVAYTGYSSPSRPFASEVYTMYATAAEPIITPSQSPNSTPQSPTPSQSPIPSVSPSPSVPEFPSWIIPPLLVVTLFSVGVIRKRKSKPTAN